MKTARILMSLFLVVMFFQLSSWVSLADAQQKVPPKPTSPGKTPVPGPTPGAKDTKPGVSPATPHLQSFKDIFNSNKNQCTSIMGCSSFSKGPRALVGNNGRVGIFAWGESELDVAVQGAHLTSGNVGSLGWKDAGVWGVGASTGVLGEATQPGGSGVIGHGTSGVFGSSQTGYGINGWGYGTSIGVQGLNMTSQANINTVGLLGDPSYGVYGEGRAQGTYAAVFKGDVLVKSKKTGNVVIQFGEGLDFAEGFKVSDKREILPGTVLIIDPKNPGKLTISDRPYDTKVAGIVAGAKGLGSGVMLSSGQTDHSVALAGRVYCNVDAAYGEVSPGDLLTTSPTPGHAMVVKDHAKAQGAILGKAMEALEKDKTGQILVLVTLQ